MILVDTSVLIDSLKGIQNEKVDIFKKVIRYNIPYGISAYTYQELLQGAKDEKEYQALTSYLSTQKIYFLPQVLDTYAKSARMYFELRRHDITPRSTIDIMIALTAIEYDLLLLHNDRDFDKMAGAKPDIRILRIIF